MGVDELAGRIREAWNTPPWSCDLEPAQQVVMARIAAATALDPAQKAEGATVRLVMDWDAQSPEQDEALVEEVVDLANPWLDGLHSSWTATYPQIRVGS